MDGRAAHAVIWRIQPLPHACSPARTTRNTAQAAPAHLQRLLIFELPFEQKLLVFWRDACRQGLLQVMSAGGWGTWAARMPNVT